MELECELNRVDSSWDWVASTLKLDSRELKKQQENDSWEPTPWIVDATTLDWVLH